MTVVYDCGALERLNDVFCQSKPDVCERFNPSSSTQKLKTVIRNGLKTNAIHHV